MRTSRSSVSASLIVLIAAGSVGCGGTSPGPLPSQPTNAGAVSPTNKGRVTAQTKAASTTAASPTEPASPAVTESNPPGDIPDNQAFVTFAPSGDHLSVKVPEGWARSTKGAATEYTDKLNRIDIAPLSAGSAPTVASVTKSDVPRLQSTVPRFTLGKISTGHRSAGPIILLTYQGDSPVDPVTGKVVRDAFERYIYYHAGKRLDLTLSGPVNADNVDPWKLVSDSVRWK